MGYAPALRVALELVHMPSRVRTLRASPLPEGVVVLLKIASGDDATAIEAAELSGRSLEIVRNAAAFFIEQILLLSGGRQLSRTRRQSKRHGW